MVYWAWLLFGLGLLVLEVATPGGFVALFFGLAALMVGLLVGLDLAGPEWMQWLLFSGLSIATLAVLRKPLQSRLGVKASGRPVDSMVGEAAVASGDIAPGEIGKAEMRGTSWSAKNTGTEAIVAGQRVRVSRVEGLMLNVHRDS